MTDELIVKQGSGHTGSISWPVGRAEPTKRRREVPSGQPAKKQRQATIPFAGTGNTRWRRQPICAAITGRVPAASVEKAVETDLDHERWLAKRMPDRSRPMRTPPIMK
jgi:hypothetical protein